MENGNAFTTQIAASSTKSFETNNSEEVKIGDLEFLFII